MSGRPLIYYAFYVLLCCVAKKEFLLYSLSLAAYENMEIVQFGRLVFCWLSKQGSECFNIMAWLLMSLQGFSNWNLWMFNCKIIKPNSNFRSLLSWSALSSLQMISLRAANQWWCYWFYNDDDNEKFISFYCATRKKSRKMRIFWKVCALCCRFLLVDRRLSLASYFCLVLLVVFFIVCPFSQFILLAKHSLGFFLVGLCCAGSFLLLCLSYAANVGRFTFQQRTFAAFARCSRIFGFLLAVSWTVFFWIVFFGGFYPLNRFLSSCREFCACWWKLWGFVSRQWMFYCLLGSWRICVFRCT